MFVASVIITTKNRKDDLRQALRSAIQQTAEPEVLVIDDGSTDGTADMVRSEFPEVRLYCSDTSCGYIVQRNRGAQLATGDFVFSIDDDAIFSKPTIVEETLAEFDNPRIGAVAIPFIDVNKDGVVKQKAPNNDKTFLTDCYIGTAHALRRDVFLRLGGYREIFVHQGEEGDYCIRMLNAGYVVRLGNTSPIHHFESPKRDTRRMDLYGRRNDVLFAWMNVPLTKFPLHLLATTVNGLRFGWQVKRPLRMAHGLLLGYIECLSQINKRQPVSTDVYCLSRALRRTKSLTLQEIDDRLPPLNFIRK